MVKTWYMICGHTTHRECKHNGHIKPYENEYIRPCPSMGKQAMFSPWNISPFIQYDKSPIDIS